MRLFFAITLIGIVSNLSALANSLNSLQALSSTTNNIPASQSEKSKNIDNPRQNQPPNSGHSSTGVVKVKTAKTGKSAAQTKTNKGEENHKELREREKDQGKEKAIFDKKRQEEEHVQLAEELLETLQKLRTYQRNTRKNLIRNNHIGLLQSEEQQPMPVPSRESNQIPNSSTEELVEFILTLPYEVEEAVEEESDWERGGTEEDNQVLVTEESEEDDSSNELQEVAPLINEALMSIRVSKKRSALAGGLALNPW